MRFHIMLFLYLYLLPLQLSANENNALLFHENFNNNNKEHLPAELLSVYETIELQSTISPGDSVLIDLSTPLNEDDSIYKISTNNVKNKLPNFIDYYEVGAFRIINTKSFYFYLSTRYCNNELYIYLTVFNTKKN